MIREKRISVVIPTHDRYPSLRRILEALRVQTLPADSFEVIVVADGCRDGTAERLEGYRAPFDLEVIEQRGSGAAAARNRGAAVACGELLVFLDDDVEPTPRLLEAHAEAHEPSDSRVAIGPYPPVADRDPDFFRLHTRAWWCDRFDDLNRTGHRFGYRDLLSGNLSVTARSFSRIGGFDPEIPGCGGEDWEFGVRAIHSGADFVFCPDAVADHHERETMSLERSFARARQEGRSDVAIGRRHPDLRPSLGLADFEAPASRLGRRLRGLAVRAPALGDRIAGLLTRGLFLLERAKARRRWRGLYGHLIGYSYWRGVGEALGSWQALADFLEEGPARPPAGHEIEIDLAKGIEAAGWRIDLERPDAIVLRLGSQRIGGIPAVPGSEKLRGVHLAPVLAEELALPLLKVLGVEATASGPRPDEWD